MRWRDGLATVVRAELGAHQEHHATGARKSRVPRIRRDGLQLPNIDAPGYFGYFGPLAGEPGKGYYSFDLGAGIWSRSTPTAGRWAAAGQDLRRSNGCGRTWPPTRPCTLAYWHHPLFSLRLASPGIAGGALCFRRSTTTTSRWCWSATTTTTKGSRPRTRRARSTLAGGVREFIVGTGGKVLYVQGAPLANSEARSQSFGVLELTLRPASYDWRFVSDTGMLFSDMGSQACDNPPSDLSRPEAPTGLTATAAGATEVDLAWTAPSDNLGVTRYEIYREDRLVASSSTALASYTDTTASPSTTYQYVVRARDAAGNLSLASNAVTVTTLPANAVVFGAEADARVEEANPDVNYGTSYLRADGGNGQDARVVSHLRRRRALDAGSVSQATSLCVQRDRGRPGRLRRCRCLGGKRDHLEQSPRTGDQRNGRHWRDHGKPPDRI